MQLEKIHIFWLCFSCLVNWPIRLSACSNLVSKPIQTTTLFIIGFWRCCWFSSDQGKVQISTLLIKWKLRLPPPKKKVLSSMKTNAYSMVLSRQHRLLLKATNLVKMFKKLLAFIKLGKQWLRTLCNLH